MNWSALSIQQLVYLDAVARLGHFGQAADDVDVSQPALSQGLRRVEELVGAALFETQGRRRILTPVGRTMADYAAGVLASSRAVATTVRAQHAGAAGSLSVGMIDAAALYLLSDELAGYRSQFPDVELHLTIDTSSLLLSNLAAGTLDLAIVVGPAPSFALTEVLSEPLHVYAADDRDLAGLDPWVLYPATSHTRSVIDAAFAARGVRPVVDAESGNPSVLAQLARLGVGATVLPPGITEPLASGLTLVEENFAVRTLVAARRVDSAPEATVDGFLQAISSTTQIQR